MRSTSVKKGSGWILGCPVLERNQVLAEDDSSSLVLWSRQLHNCIIFFCLLLQGGEGQKPTGTLCIKCSDESQLFVMAKVHAAKYREAETIHPFPHHHLPNQVHPQHWVRQENQSCCPIGKLYSGIVHLYKEMQSLPLAESKWKGKKMFVAVGNSSQFTHKGHLKTMSSQPQRRSSL